ncbi:MAG: TonB-dependent receptor [Candidatus Obscuribacterales bacterium]|nr:TonB-dependent receptor [Candidatus Obscuribacterales bacterium]
MALENNKIGRLITLLFLSTLFLPQSYAQDSIPASSPTASSAPESGKTETGKAAPAQAKLAPAAQGSALVFGVVSDSKGARKIEDAHVVLSRFGEEHKRFDMHTGPDGLFRFEKVPAGHWTLTVSAKEMLSHTSRIVLKAAESKEINISLEDMESVDVLRVTGKRTLIHPDHIGNETNLDHKFIYQYKSGNDLRDLINSTPGVLNDSYGNMITRGEHNAINYEIDGVVLPESAGVLQQSQLVSPRSLQNMTVNIGGYEASDGGGPLGAVAHMKSLPILAKPNFNIGQQIGGPLAGSIYYNGSSALSQKPDSVWNKVRVESSGSFQGTSYRLAPPVKNYVNNNGFDVNSFSKLEFRPTERDILRLTASLNATISSLPTSRGTRAAGYHGSQIDGQHYLIASYIHKFEKYLDEANIHFLNGFYYQKFRTSLAFDPYPNFNAEQPLYSIAAKSKRSNYIFSVQGNVTKNIAKTHHFKSGFLTELRPVKTNYNAVYYNADLVGSLQQQAQARGDIASNNSDINSTLAAIDAANAAADAEALEELNATLNDLLSTNASLSPNPFPYGAMISPFTGQLGGPQFLGPVGRFQGFRWLQSAYIQDKITPQKGVWKRLTLDGGVRFDMQRSIYGNSLPLAQTIASVPGVQPFSLAPYMSKKLTDAQASGRYGATFVVAKNTVLRASYSDIFTPTPVDYFLTPYLVTEPNVGGIFEGTPRPLHATRGRLVDSSIETQIGPRFSSRSNLFWKELSNFGDSGVVGNLPLYNRLTNSAQNAYGVEIRIDLKSAKDGYGFNGFLSNTVQVAYLRGLKVPTGGFYTSPGLSSEKFADHDRRLSSVVGLGYKSRQNWWVLLSTQILTGLQDSRDPELYGPHNARTPAFTNMSISCGYQPNAKTLKKHPYLPSSFDVRIENALNQRIPVNLGSPFQGTRYSLPIRVLAGFAWQLGPPEAKLSSRPHPNSVVLKPSALQI